MRSPIWAALVALPLLAACSGGGSSLPHGSASPAGAPATGQADAQTRMRSALASASSAVDHRIYVSNNLNNSITVYNFDDNGNVAPNKIIAGNKTGINRPLPGGLTEDAAGNLYLISTAYVVGEAEVGAVLVFAHGASGNVAPIRTIAGDATGFGTPYALSIDPSTGDLLVNNFTGSNIQGPLCNLLRFSPTANGNVAPLASSASANSCATQMARDSTGKNLIWAAQYVASATTDQVFYTIDTIGTQFSDGGALSINQNISDFAAAGIADDPSTQSYFASTDNRIYHLAENTTGAGPMSPAEQFNPGAIGIIKTRSGCFFGNLAAAPGSRPDIYAIEICSPNFTFGIAVYNNSAKREATPVRFISGPATQLDSPQGITEGI